MYFLNDFDIRFNQSIVQNTYIPMENNSTAYQLAHSYHTFIKTHPKNRQSLDQLPSLPSEYIQFSQNLLFPTFFNIFAPHHHQPTLDRLQNLSTINYKIVGALQARSHQHKLDKKRRNQYSTNKQLDSTVSLAQSYCRIYQDHTRLTKDQVIKMCPPTNQTKDFPSQQIYLKDQNSDQIQKSFDQNVTNKDQTTYLMNCSINKSQQHSFYVSKIKSRLQDYKTNWQKIIKNKENMALDKHKPSHKKLTSLLQRVDGYRQCNEERLRNTLHEQQHNIQPNLWSSILRSCKSLRQVNKKQFQHVVKVGMSCLGKQKLRKQIEWIQKKDTEGCFFKKHPINLIPDRN